MLINEIRDIEYKYNITILYITYVGSKLYGTDSENSDTDIKFIYLSDKKDILLKKDKDTIKITKNTNKFKNTKYDIDLDGISIHKFFSLLKKSETTSIDLLFSIFNKTSTINKRNYFIEKIKGNYESLISKNTKAFEGFTLSQTLKYENKSKKYNFLKEFLNELKKHTNENNILKNILYLDIFKNENIKTYYKNNLKYITIMGKDYPETCKVSYFFDSLHTFLDKYGERTKNIKNNIDYKSLSHALRLSYELKELLTTSFITFPLKNREEIKQVKYSKTLKIEEILNKINEISDNIEYFKNISDLNDKVDEAVMDKLLLDIINFY